MSTILFRFFTPKTKESITSTTKMITDTTLTILCNSVGGVVMALIFAYHFVVINSKDNSESFNEMKNSESSKEKKNSELSKEKKRSEPSKEKKRSEPYKEKRRSESFKERK